MWYSFRDVNSKNNAGIADTIVLNHTKQESFNKNESNSVKMNFNEIDDFSEEKVINAKKVLTPQYVR